MAIKIEPGLEPIPGYKVIKRLGGGGYGEVWKAQAPGGFFKAIKFVHGNIDARQADGTHPAAQELGALRRILTIRHPFILSLERYDIVQGQLVIVMELADRNLRNRWKDAEAQGQQGIPRDELLRYMEETAEALDFMNITHNLQHLDIKPANLFLVQNHVKVADFGLVRNAETMKADEEMGITPDYAAPELWLSGLSRACDQYSLAICFQELLTGTRPFEAKTLPEWRRQHLQYPPNVAPLPEADRNIIIRALAKKPKDRWPSCTDMVKALKQNSGDAPTKPVLAGGSLGKLRDTLTPQSGKQVLEIECPHCRRKGKVPIVFQGKEVKCPGCTKPFVIQGPPPLDIPDEVGLSPMEEDKHKGKEELAKIEPGKEPELLVDAKCPKCGHKGYVPEKFVGKKLKCRKCATAFVVAQPPPVRKKM
jgi:serine/threonine protein kinase